LPNYWSATGQRYLVGCSLKSAIRHSPTRVIYAHGDFRAVEQHLTTMHRSNFMEIRARNSVAGFFARKWVKAKTKSKFADLSDNMKKNGFQCKRCEHLFIPVEHLPAGRAQVASA
jgi:hypothetical protein